jgi:hypothetical protein
MDPVPRARRSGKHALVSFLDPENARSFLASLERLGIRQYLSRGCAMLLPLELAEMLEFEGLVEIEELV